MRLLYTERFRRNYANAPPHIQTRCDFRGLRRRTDYLMFIHEHLPKPMRRELKQIGWTKAAELAKVASDSQCGLEVHHTQRRSQSGDDSEGRVRFDLPAGLAVVLIATRPALHGHSDMFAPAD